MALVTAGHQSRGHVAKGEHGPKTGGPGGWWRHGPYDCATRPGMVFGSGGQWAWDVVVESPEGSQDAQADGLVAQQLQIGLAPVGGQLGGHRCLPTWGRPHTPIGPGFQLSRCDGI